MKSLFKTKICNCTLSLILNTSCRNQKDTYPISIRASILSKTKYYNTNYSFSVDEYDILCDLDLVTDKLVQKKYMEIKNELCDLIDPSASNRNIISELKNYPSMINFDILDSLLRPRNEKNFIEYWGKFNKTKKLSTSNIYETARKSFIHHVGKTSGFRVNVFTIKAWVNGMKESNISSTTQGIYLRSLRVFWNECIRKGYIDKDNYPFGKYGNESSVKIPHGRTRKTSFLSINQMTELFLLFKDGSYKNYNSNEMLTFYQKRHLGLFLFMYLGNGMNLADVARLTYQKPFFRSQQSTLQFVRTKTKDSNDVASEVIIPVISPLRFIIEQIGSIRREGGMVFDWILDGATNEDEIILKIKNTNSNIKKCMKRIAKKINWDVCPTAAWCRHSFATNLTYCNVPHEYIKTSMGHSDSDVTSRYINVFPFARIAEYNQLLLDIPYEKNKESMTRLTRITAKQMEILNEISKMDDENLNALMLILKRK